MESHLAHSPRRKNIAQYSNAPIHGAIMVELPLTQTSAHSPAGCYLLAPANIVLLARDNGSSSVQTRGLLTRNSPLQLNGLNRSGSLLIRDHKARQ